MVTLVVSVWVRYVPTFSFTYSPYSRQRELQRLIIVQRSLARREEEKKRENAKMSTLLKNMLPSILFFFLGKVGCAKNPFFWMAACGLINH